MYNDREEVAACAKKAEEAFHNKDFLVAVNPVPMQQCMFLLACSVCQGPACKLLQSRLGKIAVVLTDHSKLSPQRWDQVLPTISFNQH